MDHSTPAQPLSEDDRTSTNRFLLAALPVGHLANDWPGAALWVLAPAIAQSMGLGPVEVGLLITIHSVGASVAYVPAGIVGDYFRNRGNLLAITFWWVAIGYFAAASADNLLAGGDSARDRWPWRCGMASPCNRGHG